MSSLGQLNHVLTNAGTGGSTTLTYTCVNVYANGNCLYRETGGSPDSDILYHPVNGWSDFGSSNPYHFGGEIPVSTIISPAYDATELIITDNNFNILAVLNTGYVTGPTVTSITATKIFVPSDTVSNTDFTLLKNGSAYANTNISLTGPGPQLPSDGRGYAYTLTYDGTAWYTRTVDSKSFNDFYYDSSWTSTVSGTTAQNNRQTTSNRILNVIGTIPSSTTIGSGSNNPLTTVFSNISRVITYTYSTTISNVATTIDITFHVDKKIINGVSEITGVFREARTANSIVNATFSSAIYIIGNQETMTYVQNLLGVATTYYVSDWIYSAEPEGDGYVAPVSTTSDGGGKQRRYPIISTNLFDRQRSIFSIGNTHKDETLF